MDIRILHMIEGAKAARGIAVVIDVFRAMTVEAYLAKNGAARIFPVGDMQIAYDYREQHPDTLLVGERHGAILPGFDFGNCPTDLEHLDLSGRTVVHTTSAGTQGLANAGGADEVLAGSLVCAHAICRYIRRKNPAQVSLVCMGLSAQRPIEEDTLCAEYIKSVLEGHPLPDLEDRIADLKRTSGAKFFDPALQNVFPTHDFELCTRVGQFDFVLKMARDEETGMDMMVPVPVD